mgnify:CR=1 FL=1
MIVLTHTHKNVPYSPEVWTTVATGVGPEVHGVTGDAQDRENSILNVPSQLTQYLPRQWRRILGKPFRDTDGDNDGIQIRHSETNTTFDAGEVWLWLGVSDAPHLIEAWRWMREISDGVLTNNELRQNLLANTGREFGWLASLNKASIPIAGVHSHILDTAGHVFADRPELLREYYILVDEMVNILKENCNRLVILSDHGIQSSETGDQEIGRHSMRAMVSTQEVNDLPESVFDVCDWLSPIRPYYPR